MSIIVSVCDRGAARPDTAKPVEPTDSVVAQIGFGIRHELTTGGVRRAEVRADTATFNEAGTGAELHGVRLVLYSAAGDSVGVLVAPAGTYDLRARRVALRGGVTRVVGGRRSVTADAVYDAGQGRVVDNGVQPPAARRGAGSTRR